MHDPATLLDTMRKQAARTRVAHSVTLWQYDLDDFGSALEDVLPYLPDDAQKRARAISNPVRRDQYVGSRLLLMLAATQTLGIGALRVSLAERRPLSPQVLIDGRPAKNCFTSISHSKKALAVAIGRHPVGVDIEFIDETRDIASLSTMAFDRRTRQMMERLPADGQIAFFYRNWCEGEAAYKQACLAAGKVSESRLFANTRQASVLSWIRDGYAVAVCFDEK